MKFIADRNSIDPTTQLYLNVLKRRFQKDKDNREMEYIKMKKRDIIDKKIDELYKKLFGNAINDIIEIKDYHDYLSLKYDKYMNVQLANNEIRKEIMEIKMHNDF